MADSGNNCLVGVDLGGTKILAGVFDHRMSLIGAAKFSTKPNRGPEAVLERIVRCVGDAVDECDLTLKEVRAIGVGAPGTVAPASGEVISAPNLPGWTNIPLARELSARLQLPVYVGNDCHLCTLGVHRHELASKPRHLVALFIGTGVGGGLILNGELYLGHNRTAGEVGHMVIQADGPECGCGNRGCLEALTSRKALLQRLQLALQAGETTILTEMLGPELRDFRSGDLRRALRRGDRLVERLILEAAQFLGIAVANLINLFSPEVVVLGGGVIDALESDMMPVIVREAERRVLAGSLKDVRVVASKLGDHAGITGAALWAQAHLG